MFNLCHELADDALGWIGNVGKSNIGRDTEGKVSNAFVMGGRFGATAATAGTGGAAKMAVSKAVPEVVKKS